ncbi:unnamed protein product [Calicophoron daubneyi]|uniref:Helicase-associated domain-containing protein n=1 Tax=Calicophoron daubneyi TaxID=300641 RepID=A0AAV2TWC8_CALDB
MPMTWHACFSIRKWQPRLEPSFSLLILLYKRVSQSLRHIPENWESVLLRFGSWLDSPISHSPFDTCTLEEFQPPLSADSSCGSEHAVCYGDLDNQLLTIYHTARNITQPDSVVDFDLLLVLLAKLDMTMHEGTILIFLPSYEEIIALREKLINPETSPWGYSSKHVVFILHSRMLVADLTKILSSSIAQTCMSFDDVAFVIDCGLDCTKGYVEWTGTTLLRNHWISKATAIQRQTRCGSNVSGICFRLYSRIRFNYLNTDCCTPLRGPPVEEACIQARLLAPPGVPIQAILSTVPRPPIPSACQDAVRSLKEIDALDTFEDFTELGYHICDIPIPPRYAKMVLISVALKCLDPILTIACILTYTEPFTVPKNAAERRDLLCARKKFSADTFSDHMMLLRAFQFWQKARSEGWEKSFCQKNYISTAAFEIITVIRTQLLGQLRASGFVKARGSGDIRDLNTNSENWAVVKAAIVAGMNANFVKVDRSDGRLKASSGVEIPIQLHPHSVLASNTDGTPITYSSLPCDWLVYDELVTLSTQAPQKASDSRSSENVSGCWVADTKEAAGDTMTELESMFRGIGVSSTSGGSRLSLPQLTTIRKIDVAKIAECTKTGTKQTHGRDHDNLHQERLGMLRCVTIVSPITVALMAGPMRLRPELLRETDVAIYDLHTAWMAYQQQSQQQHQPGPSQQSSQYLSRLHERAEQLKSDSNLPAWPNFTADESTTSVTNSSTEETEKATEKECRKSDADSSDSDSEAEEIWATLLGEKNYKRFLQKRRDFMRCNVSSDTQFTKSVKKDGGSSVCSSASFCAYPEPSLRNSAVDSDFVPLKLDDKELLQFHMDPITAQLVVALRQKWHALLLRRLRNPGKQCSQQDEAILSVLVTVLTSEEQVLGLRQPSGVGARPRPMAAELCNQFDYPDLEKPSHKIDEIETHIDTDNSSTAYVPSPSKADDTPRAVTSSLSSRHRSTGYCTPRGAVNYSGTMAPSSVFEPEDGGVRSLIAAGQVNPITHLLRQSTETPAPPTQWTRTNVPREETGRNYLSLNPLSDTIIDGICGKPQQANINRLQLDQSSILHRINMLPGSERSPILSGVVKATTFYTRNSNADRARHVLLSGTTYPSDHCQSANIDINKTVSNLLAQSDSMNLKTPPPEPGRPSSDHSEIQTNPGKRDRTKLSVPL